MHKSLLIIFTIVLIVGYGIFQNNRKTNLNPNVEASPISLSSPTPVPSNSPTVEIKKVVKPTLSNSPTPSTNNPSSLTLNSVSPNPANSGATITLKGSGFGPSNHRVWFYNTLGLSLYSQIDSWNDTEIITKVPNLSQGSFEVQVEKSDGTKSNRLSFNVGSGQPIISSYPLTTNAGSPITLIGKSFGSSQGKINIRYANNQNGVYTQCNISSWGENQITCTIPTSLSHGPNEYGLFVQTIDNRQSSTVYIQIN